MKKKYVAVALCVVLGIGCVALAERILAEISSPNLYLQLILPEAKSTGRVALRFLNVGRRSAVIDLTGMRYFLVPDSPRRGRYTLYAKPASRASGRRDGMRPAVLLPGEYVDSGDLRSLLANLPKERVILSAAYFLPTAGSGEWQGLFPPAVRSLPQVHE